MSIHFCAPATLIAAAVLLTGQPSESRLSAAPVAKTPAKTHQDNNDPKYRVAIGGTMMANVSNQSDDSEYIGPRGKMLAVNDPFDPTHFGIESVATRYFDVQGRKVMGTSEMELFVHDTNSQILVVVNRDPTIAVVTGDGLKHQVVVKPNSVAVINDAVLPVIINLPPIGVGTSRNSITISEPRYPLTAVINQKSITVRSGTVPKVAIFPEQSSPHTLPTEQ